MRNTPRIFRALGSILCSLTLVAAAPAAGEESPELRCRSGIESGLHTFLIKSLKARTRCQADILDGFEHPATNCLTGAGSAVLPGRLFTARAKLLRRIASSCGDARWNLLSYPGPCPASQSFGEQSLTQCMDGIAREVAGRLFDVWYPAELTPARGPASECIKGIAKRASSMVLRETRVRLQCLEENERPGAGSGIDCRGQIPPYGNGTFDEHVNDAIIRAEEAWLGGLPEACIAEFPSIGFGQNCPASGDSFGILAFHTCVFRTNRLQIPLLVDLAFPSAPVCGNGVLQEGEACDDGAGNSDSTPDACRTDCTFPICGDGTADPGRGESCDDGDHEDLDGCTADCVLEFCGDGEVNDLPNEDCDDGNSNPNDLCTGDCLHAVCGDGVVCSAASCTSGPEGGPELCDNGVDNASGAMCDVDCSGFTRSCTLRIGVTNATTIGSLTYELLYANADGELSGIGSRVECTSLLPGSLASFFDNETTRKMKESVIVDAGFAAPKDIAECEFVTNDTGLAGADFAFQVISATDTGFEPVSATMGVTSVACGAP